MTAGEAGVVGQDTRNRPERSQETEPSPTPDRERCALRVAVRTDQGRLRLRNEDAVLVDHERCVFAVADGMGGHPAGDVASRVAVEHLPALIASALGSPLDAVGATLPKAAPGDVDAALERALVELNDVILAEAAQDPDHVGMGTTVVLALFTGLTAHVAHVGDSRAYLFRPGELHQLTEDDSLANALIRGGVAPDDARHHPYAERLTQAVGTAGGIQPTVRGFELSAGDRLLLCSDGLTRMLVDARIGMILATEPDPEAASQALVDAANHAGGEDNISVVLIDVRDS